MTFFGQPWPSGVCDGGRQVPTPVGADCLLCEYEIKADDQGTFMGYRDAQRPVHRECSLRSVVGGIGHLEDHQFWCVDAGDPDGGRDYRQSALEVWEWVGRHGTRAAV